MNWKRYECYELIIIKLMFINQQDMGIHIALDYNVEYQTICHKHPHSILMLSTHTHTFANIGPSRFQKQTFYICHRVWCAAKIFHHLLKSIIWMPSCGGEDFIVLRSSLPISLLHSLHVHSLYMYAIQSHIKSLSRTRKLNLQTFA